MDREEADERSRGKREVRNVRGVRRRENILKKSEGGGGKEKEAKIDATSWRDVCLYGRRDRVKSAAWKRVEIVESCTKKKGSRSVYASRVLNKCYH